LKMYLYIQNKDKPFIQNNTLLFDLNIMIRFNYINVLN